MKTFPKCECGGVAVTNASGDITRTCIRCGKLVKPIQAKLSKRAQDWVALNSAMMAIQVAAGDVVLEDADLHMEVFKFVQSTVTQALIDAVEWNADRDSED